MYNGITLLRCVAAFFIVGCHLQLFPRTEGGAAITSLCDMNVGLFAAISGFLMVESLDKSGATVEGYVLKRAVRLLPGYFFWTVFYLFASLVFSFVTNREIDYSKYFSLKFWLDVALWGGASCHLWFIASLLYANVLLSGCYSVLRRVRLTPILFLAFGLLLVSLATYSRAFMFRYPCRLIGFVSLGMVVKMLHDRMPIGQRLSIVFLCAGLGFYVIFGWHLHPFVRSLVVVLPLLSVFARKELPLYGGRVVECLSGFSMGVFLFHPFFAAGMAAIIPKFASPPFGVGVVLSDWFVVYVLALIGTMVMNRVPALERFVK